MLSLLAVLTPAVPAAAEVVSKPHMGAVSVAVAEDDVTISLEASGYSAARMLQILAETQSRNARISDTVKQDFEANPNGMGAGFDDWSNFNGQLGMTPTTVYLTITDGAPLTNAGFWEEVLATVTGLLTGLVLRALCIGFMPEAAVLCVSIGGFFGGLVRGIIIQHFDGTLRDGTAWAKTLVGAILAAAGGAAWEGGVKDFAKDVLPGYIQAAGNTLVRWGETAAGWGAWFRDGAKAAGRFLWEVAKAVPDAVSKIRVPGMTRVMPLGDSITEGVGSPTGSGYRIALQSGLRNQGFQYDFVGSLSHGQGGDLNHEGHSGWRIDQIQGQIEGWLNVYRPDLVTLHLGTNDMIQNYQTGTAAERLATLIDRVFTFRPTVAVVVSTLVPSRTPSIDARIRQFNRETREVVRGRQEAGRHIVLVDMAEVTPADIADDVHPGDNGYRKMAKIFNIGVVRAAMEGWITPQPGPGPVSCTPGPDPTGGSGREAWFADFNGDGRDDYLALRPGSGSVRTWLNNGADYSGDHWVACGVTASGTNTGVGQGRVLLFGDLDGDRRDDYLAVNPATGETRAWVNRGAENGGDRWEDRGVIASGTNTGVTLLGRVAQFADIDGDGRDDYLSLDPRTGHTRAWLNRGADRGGDHWLDKGVIASGTNTGVSLTGRYVQFADIDGDGRDDYLAIDPANGNTRAWRNVGAENGGDKWEDRGVIASGTNTGVSRTGRIARFGDLNGDVRADYLAIDPANGSVRGWINVRADVPGDHWIDRGLIASGTNTGVGG
ncbi:GDSL-type esterase/lipase family protein [Streptosporangium oxazolinicum]|uniref:GDSL-type esterase/lipase family protein n=1 Tax=Streptosporangium oxazolinicum TaxID=909287 RepID=UPI0031ECEF35